jgi:uncharacterized protein (DUF983 family)
MIPENVHAPRDLMLSLWRGFLGHCPSCGKGKLFRAFLKVADQCPACGEHLHHHRADDMPAYLVIVIVGHIVVPMLLAVEKAFRPELWIHAVLWLPLTLAMSIALLPRVKGTIVGLQWALRMHGFDGKGGDELERIPLQSTHSAHSRESGNPEQLAHSGLALGPRFPAAPTSPVQGEYPARQLPSRRAGRSRSLSLGLPNAGPEGSPARRDERNSGIS